MPSRAPTSELGGTSTTGGVPPWQAYIDESEQVPDLIWPSSVAVYRAMLNDSQIGGLLRGSTLPIRRYRWMIDPNGSRPEVYQRLAEDLNLPVRGEEPQPRGRSKRRFSHDRHLFHALLALAYGHYFFEQVGEIGDDSLWHLRKLAPRPPHTLAEINVERDGGLKSIKQNILIAPGAQQPEIPVDRLVAYVWDQEGGNWTGRSMLRPLYRNWLIKDRLLRIDAINHERAGGIPYIEAPEDATAEQMAALGEFAQQFKVGENAGGAVPYGAKLAFASPSGNDTISSIRFHNEEMARAFLMMFMQLGQTETGSRALGGEFIDFFTLAQEAIAQWYADITNEHVIEDWVDWNFGEEEQAPLLVFERNEDPSLSVSDLATLVQQGIVQVDEELEATIRERFKLPKKAEGASTPVPSSPQPTPGESVPTPPSPQPTPGEGVEAKRQRRAVRAATGNASPLRLPDRPLRRQPQDYEVAAQVDFAELEKIYVSAINTLVDTWREKVKETQVDELQALIREAGEDVEKLSTIQASVLGEDLLAQVMRNLVDEGVAGALDEAKAQGVDLPEPDLTEVYSSIDSRALATATLMARSISEAAGRKAVSLVGGGLSIEEIAEEVGNHLRGLSDTYIQDVLGGAVQQSINTGRRAAMRVAKVPTRYYASELLDSNTCENCVEKDGTEYASLEEAEQDYPTGGYKDCLGGPRCRGTIVAVYNEEEASVQ